MCTTQKPDKLIMRSDRSIMIALVVLLIVLGLCLGGSEGKLVERFSWKSFDFTYPSEDARQEAITKKAFIPESNFPTAIAVSNEKIFVSIPRRRPGVPATLAYFTREGNSTSPKLIPYPSFKDNEVDENKCDNIISVNRGMQFDNCDRLWVFDYGKTGLDKDLKQVCPPRIHVFDLKTNKKLRMFPLKKTDYTATSLFTSATVELGKTCDDHYLYITDEIALIVYSWKENDAWRFEHPFFGVDPIATNFKFPGYEVQSNGAGIFAVALSPILKDGFRTLYFHPLASFREFGVSTKTLHDKKKVKDNYHDFFMVGSREKLGHSTSEVMDHSGVLFFNLIDKNATACWNSMQPYDTTHNIAIVAEDNEKLFFPSASVIDGHENLWILSNRFPEWISGKMNYKSVNFRILSAPVEDLQAGTSCALSGSKNAYY